MGPNSSFSPAFLPTPVRRPCRAADYEIVGRLGQGGMGVVLAARQASVNRSVALKKISPAHATDPESRLKFLTEAVVTGDLEHPNIVPIYDVGKDESGLLFYSMKHVKGTPWDQVITQRSITENLEILMKVADAVAFAHSRNVVHRDLKPENVMLGDYGEVLVMDWGLAIKLDSPAAKSAGLGGTPAYMAPEMVFTRPDGDRLCRRHLSSRRNPLRNHHRQPAARRGNRLRLPECGLPNRDPAHRQVRRARGDQPQGDGHAACGPLRRRGRFSGGDPPLLVAFAERPALGPRR